MGWWTGSRGYVIRSLIGLKPDNCSPIMGDKKKKKEEREREKKYIYIYLFIYFVGVIKSYHYGFPGLYLQRINMSQRYRKNNNNNNNK